MATPVTFMPLIVKSAIVAEPTLTFTFAVVTVVDPKLTINENVIFLSPLDTVIDADDAVIPLTEILTEDVPSRLGQPDVAPTHATAKNVYTGV